MTSARRNAGIALITALLVVAIATLAATALLAASNLSIHRTAALRDTEQGWWVARGVESWVLGILRQDAEENDFDALGEAWAQPVDYLPVDQGFIQGHIVDLQGLFNLNNLATRDPPRLEAYRAQFERLLAGLESETAAPVLPAILDWIDADDDAGFPSGAEDTAYLSREPPYRAANRRFAVVSELLAIHGMTPELYQRLRPLVAALPHPSETPINVNTAPEGVLRALSATVDEQQLQQFLRRRVEEPAETVADFMKENIYGADVRPDQIAVGSQYFEIRGEIFVGSSRVALYSLIHRPDPGTPTVLAHSAAAE